MLFCESDLSAISLTFFGKWYIYFSFVIGNKSILPLYAIAISLVIKCES